MLSEDNFKTIIKMTKSLSFNYHHVFASSDLSMIKYSWGRGGGWEVGLLLAYVLNNY